MAVRNLTAEELAKNSLEALLRRCVRVDDDGDMTLEVTDEEPEEES